MESAAMSTSRPLHHPGSPFDPYRDPFDISSHGGAGGRDAEGAESWSSGGNESESPPATTGANNGTQGMNVNGGPHLGDRSMAMQGVKEEESKSGAHEPKKKRFVCPHCERTFARSGHLQRHERSRKYPVPTSSFQQQPSCRCCRRVLLFHYYSRGWR
jgi:Zinc finger, C2H2 type